MRELFDEVYGQSPLDPHEAVQKTQRTPLRKRFYEAAGYRAVEGGFEITLDGKTVRTPSRKPVVTPWETIAEQIAQEWNAQVDVINPLSMPLTRLANSVVEAVVDNVDAVADDMAKYLATDMLVYRASHPDELVAREAAAWDPVIYWAADDLGARFVLAEGIMHVSQSEQALAAATAAIPREPWAVSACHLVTTLSGSALLALALLRGRLSADEVWTAANVDEDWNIHLWGEDDEVMNKRVMRKRDFLAAAAVLKATAQA